MKELCLPPQLSCEIGEIYASMVTAYDLVAEAIPLSCTGCPDNCCDSYFLHHTYSEWAYLGKEFASWMMPALIRFCIGHKNMCNKASS